MDAMDRIHSAFCEMPYGGIAGFVRLPPCELTLNDVADNLENLVAALKGVAERQEETSAELGEIKAEMRAVKSLFARF